MRAQQCALAVADAPAPTIGFSTVLLMRLPYCSSAVLQPWRLPAVPFPAFGPAVRDPVPLHYTVCWWVVATVLLVCVHMFLSAACCAARQASKCAVQAVRHAGAFLLSLKWSSKSGPAEACRPERWTSALSVFSTSNAALGQICFSFWCPAPPFHRRLH